MSTADVTLPRPSRPLGAADARPSLGRLTSIELRKAADTRAGFWLLLGVLGLIAAVVVVGILTRDDPSRITFAWLLSVAVQPASLLLPVVGILLVSSEYSQRTALTTFALVPNRGRILGAKVLAALGLTLVAFVACLALAAAGTAVASSGATGTWSLPTELLGQTLLFLVGGMLTGIGFGATFLASAPAIVLYFMLPIVFAALASIEAISSVVRWVDPTGAMSAMSEHVLSSTEWGYAGVSLALWVLLPLVVGARRVVRGEVH